MIVEGQPTPAATTPEHAGEFRKALGLFDSVMIVSGIMVGSGIFIVSAEISRQVGSAGWLLVAWIITGVLTVTGALSYGELAAMMPDAGGMYVYLREALSPLVGFLYGWTLLTVIQTGTIAAVAIAFARFSGVAFPAISETNYLVAPINLLPGYAVSLSTAQALALFVILLIALVNCGGVRWGQTHPECVHGGQATWHGAVARPGGIRILPLAVRLPFELRRCVASAQYRADRAHEHLHGIWHDCCAVRLADRFSLLRRQLA